MRRYHSNRITALGHRTPPHLRRAPARGPHSSASKRLLCSPGMEHEDEAAGHSRPAPAPRRSIRGAAAQNAPAVAFAPRAGKIPSRGKAAAEAAIHGIEFESGAGRLQPRGAPSRKARAGRTARRRERGPSVRELRRGARPAADRRRLHRLRAGEPRRGVGGEHGPCRSPALHGERGAGVQPRRLGAGAVPLPGGGRGGGSAGGQGGGREGGGRVGPVLLPARPRRTRRTRRASSCPCRSRRSPPSRSSTTS